MSAWGILGAAIMVLAIDLISIPASISLAVFCKWCIFNALASVIISTMEQCARLGFIRAITFQPMLIVLKRMASSAGDPLKTWRSAMFLPVFVMG